MSWAIPVIIEKRGMAYMKKEVEEDENSTSVVDCVGALFFKRAGLKFRPFSNNSILADNDDDAQSTFL